MKPKMIWSNLAVSDLERTTKFYAELGFKLNGSPQKKSQALLLAVTIL